MLEKNIYSESKHLFLKELNSGNVPEDAVAYIGDTKEIWTHGTYFVGKTVKSVMHRELLKMVDSNSLEAECYYDIMDYEVLEQRYGSHYMIIPDNTIKTIIRVKAIDSSTLDPNAYYIATDNTTKEKIVKVFKAKYSLLPGSTELPVSYAPIQRGAVYWLQDDLGNEAPFDFYHIRFIMNDPNTVLTPDEFGIPKEGLTNTPNGWLIDSVMPFNNPFRNFTTNNILKYYNKQNNKNNIGIAVTANPVNYGITAEISEQLAFKNNTVKINLNAENIIYAQLNFNIEGTYNNTISFDSINIAGTPNNTLLISGYNNNIVNTRGYLSAIDSTILNSIYIMRNVHLNPYYSPDPGSSVRNSYIYETIFHGTPMLCNNNIIIYGSNLTGCGLDFYTNDPTQLVSARWTNVNFKNVTCGSRNIVSFENVTGSYIDINDVDYSLGDSSFIRNGILTMSFPGVTFIPNEKIYGIGSFENPHTMTYHNFINLYKNGELIKGDYYRIIDFVTSGSKLIPSISGIAVNFNLIQNFPHQYDIILRANDTNSIQEDAYIDRPMYHISRYNKNPQFDSLCFPIDKRLHLDQFKVKISHIPGNIPAYVIYNDTFYMFAENYLIEGSKDIVCLFSSLAYTDRIDSFLPDIYFNKTDGKFYDYKTNKQITISTNNIIYQQFDITYMKDDHDNEYNFDAISTRLSLVNTSDSGVNNNIVQWYPALYTDPFDTPLFYNENCYRNKFESFSSFMLIDVTEIKDNIISNSLVLGLDGCYKINNCTISNITTREYSNTKLPYINLILIGLDYHNDHVFKLNNTHIDLINYDEFNHINVANNNFIITNAVSTDAYKEWPDKITNATITYDCQTHRWLSDAFKSEYNIIDIIIKPTENGARQLVAFIDNPMNIYEGQKILFRMPELGPGLLHIGNPYYGGETGYDFITVELLASTLPKYVNNYSMPELTTPMAYIPIVCTSETTPPIYPPVEGISDRGFFASIMPGEIIEAVFMRIVDSDPLSYAFVILSPHSSSTRNLIQNMCSEMIQNEMGNINAILESIINE